MNSPSHPKQTNQTAKLGKRIRRLRERRKPMIWTDICRKFKIFTPSGQPATGTASKIAYDEYEPFHREVRTRLGLRDMCTVCGRPYRNKTIRKPRTEIQSWWVRLSAEDREAILLDAYKLYMKGKQ